MSLKPTHEKCFVRGCRASNKSLHRLPKEKHIADKWIEFVFGDSRRYVSRKSFMVCTAHFAPECIHNQMQYDVGVLSKLILKKGSVPTIRDPFSSTETGTGGSIHHILPAVRHVASQTDPPEKKSVGTQLSMKTLQNHIRSTATQARVPSKDCGVCTLTFPLDSPILFLQPTIVKRPSKRPRLSLTDEEEGPSECS